MKKLKKPAETGSSQKRTSKILPWRERLQDYNINNISTGCTCEVFLMAELTANFSEAMDIFHHGAENSSTNVKSINWDDIMNNLRKIKSFNAVAVSEKEDDRTAIFKLAAREAAEYLNSDILLGKQMPTELTAKLIKLEIMKIVSDYATLELNARRKSSSRNSIKGKKGVKRESLKRSTFVIENRQMYILITQCYDSKLVEELFKCGIVLSGIIEIASSDILFKEECREYSASISSTETMVEYFDFGRDEGVLLYMSSGDESLSAGSISAIKSTTTLPDTNSKASIICHFWMGIYKLLEGVHLSEFLSDTIHLRIAPTATATAPIKDSKEYNEEALKFFSHISSEILKINDAKRQHANYLRNIKICSIEPDRRAIPLKSLKTFNNLMDKFPPECCTVEVFLFCLVEEICSRVPDPAKPSVSSSMPEKHRSRSKEASQNYTSSADPSRTTFESLSSACPASYETRNSREISIKIIDLLRKSLSTQIPPVIFQKENSTRKQSLLKEFANYIILYRKAYAPLYNRTTILYHKRYLRDPKLKIKVSNEKCIVHETSMLELWSMTYSELSLALLLIHTKYIMQPLAALWGQYSRINDMQTYFKDNLLQILSRSLEISIEETTYVMNLLFFKEFKCSLHEQETSTSDSIPTTVGLFCGKVKHNFSETLQIFETFYSSAELSTTSLFPDTVCVKIPYIHFCDKENIYESKNIHSYLWYEKLSTIVTLQQLDKAYRDFICVEKQYCPFTDCILLRFHNNVDTFGINMTAAKGSIRTLVGLRDFCKYIMHEEEDWLDEQEDIYKRRIARNQENRTSSIETPPPTGNNLKPEDCHNFIGYDHGKSIIQLDGGTATFHSLDGYKIIVDKTTLYGQPKKISINIVVMDHNFVFHYVNKKESVNLPLKFHFSLADGTIITFNKPPKVSKSHLVIGEIINKTKHQKKRSYSTYRPREKNFYYTVELRRFEASDDEKQVPTISAPKDSTIQRILPIKQTRIVNTGRTHKVKIVNGNNSFGGTKNLDTVLLRRRSSTCCKHRTYSKYSNKFDINKPCRFNPKLEDTNVPVTYTVSIPLEEDMQILERFYNQDFPELDLTDINLDTPRSEEDDNKGLPEFDSLEPGSHLTISYNSSALNKFNELEVLPLDLTSSTSTTTAISSNTIITTYTLAAMNLDEKDLHLLIPPSLKVNKELQEFRLNLPGLDNGDLIDIEPCPESPTKCCNLVKSQMTNIYPTNRKKSVSFPSLHLLEKSDLKLCTIDLTRLSALSLKHSKSKLSSCELPTISEAGNGPLSFKRCRSQSISCDLPTLQETGIDTSLYRMRADRERELKSIDYTLSYILVTSQKISINEILSKIEDAKTLQVPLFKILSSKLHTFVYVKRIKSHIFIQLGKHTISLLCHHPRYKMFRRVKLTKMFPIKVSDTTFTNNNFYDMKLSLPSGLLVYSVPGVNEKSFNIKQQYVEKGPNSKNVVDEDSRSFMRNGRLVIKKCDGSIHILSSNGQIIQCELPHMIEKTCIKYIIIRNSTQKETYSELISSKSSLIRKYKQIERFACHLQRHVIGGKYKHYRLYQKLRLKYDKEIYMFQETKDPLKFFLITNDGRKFRVTGTCVEEKGNCFHTNHNSRDSEGHHEISFVRDDGVICLLTDDGVLTTEFLDKTRISSWYTIEPEMISIDDVDNYSWGTSYSESRRSVDSYMLPRFLRDLNALQDGWIAVNIVYKFEHPNYATVIYSTLDDKAQIVLPNDVSITATERGFYSVIIDEVICTRITNEHVLVEAKLCHNCDEACITTVNVKPLYDNIYPIPESTRLLQTYDSYDKTFFVNYDGTCYRNSNYINRRSNKVECKRHYTENHQQLYLLNKDLSGSKYWDVRAYRKRMAAATRNPDSVVQFYNKTNSNKQNYSSLEIRTYNYKPHYLKFTNVYEYADLTLSKFQKSYSQLPLSYRTVLHIYALSGAIRSPLLQELMEKIFDQQTEFYIFSMNAVNLYLETVEADCIQLMKTVDKGITAINVNRNLPRMMPMMGELSDSKVIPLHAARTMLKPASLATGLTSSTRTYHLPRQRFSMEEKYSNTPFGEMIDEEDNCGCEYIMTNKERWELLGLKRPQNMFFKPGGKKTEAKVINQEKMNARSELFRELRRLSKQPKEKEEAINCYIKKCKERECLPSPLAARGRMRNAFYTIRDRFAPSVSSSLQDEINESATKQHLIKPNIHSGHGLLDLPEVYLHPYIAAKLKAQNHSMQKIHVERQKAGIANNKECNTDQLKAKQTTTHQSKMYQSKPQQVKTPRPNVQRRTAKKSSPRQHTCRQSKIREATGGNCSTTLERQKAGIANCKECNADQLKATQTTTHQSKMYQSKPQQVKTPRPNVQRRTAKKSSPRQHTSRQSKIREATGGNCSTTLERQKAGIANYKECNADQLKAKQTTTHQSKMYQSKPQQVKTLRPNVQRRTAKKSSPRQRTSRQSKIREATRGNCSTTLQSSNQQSKATDTFMDGLLTGFLKYVTKNTNPQGEQINK